MKIDVNLIKAILEVSDLSKWTTSLCNRILKLSEESWELSQSYLKYSWSVNSSKSWWETKEELIEESTDVLLVILDILNQIIETEEDQQLFDEFLKKKAEKWKNKLK